MLRRSGRLFDRVIYVHVAKAFLSEQVFVAISILIIVLAILRAQLVLDVSSDSCSAIPRLKLNNEMFILLSTIDQLYIVVRLLQVFIVLSKIKNI